MTRKVLAGIAQIMKWEFIDTDSGGVLSDNQVERRPWERMDDAKLLQQRMVDDGWDFHLSHLKTRDGLPFRASAHYDTTRYFYVGATTEPLAIFELFCAVYAIPASE